MKLNFKKISAIAGSVLMTGLTIGTAAAASFPAPFVQSGTANVALVYGASSTDMPAVTSIKTKLDSVMPAGSSVVVEGGESFNLVKSSNNFNFADSLNSIYSKLDSNQMNFLEEGVYDDGDIDTDYSQKITLGSKALTLFADADYKNKEPSTGFFWTNGEGILNYTIDFDESVNYTQMVTTDLPILGKTYYVLAASASQIDLLDTADSKVLFEGDSATVSFEGSSYDVSVVVFNDGARFTVNGVLSNKLNDGEYQKLSGTDIYLIAKSVDYVSKDSGTSQVEFALGKGKIELINGQEAKLNNERIRGLETTITTSNSKLDELTLVWKSYRDTFLTEESPISLPTFGVIQLGFGGLNMDSDPEMISVENGETLTLRMGNYDLPLAYWTGSATTAGEQDNLLKLTAGNYSYDDLGFNETTVWWNNLLIDKTNGTAKVNPLVSTLNLSETERFIVTRIDDDLSDTETLYYELSMIDIIDSDTFTIELEDLIGNKDIVLENEVGDEQEVGDITVTLRGFSEDNSSVLLEFVPTSGTITYNKAVSEKGMVVTIPTDISSVTKDTTKNLIFTEADKDEDLNEGYTFTATLKATTNNKLHVSTHNLTSYDEEESSKYYIGYVPSDLATKFKFDTNSDEYVFDLEYTGKETTANVMVIAGGEVTSTTGNPLGNVIYKDTEVTDTVKAKNLIVVGGSCINSVAADLLGGAYCGPEFTTATGISNGEALLKAYPNKYANGKVVVLVAGYEAADTQMGATYLINKNVDTSTVSSKVTTVTNAVDHALPA